MTCSSVNCCVCLSKGNESSEYNGRGRNKKNEKEKERIQGNCVCVYVVCRCWKWQQKGTPPEYSLFIAVREETDRPREGLLIYLFLHTISSGCVCVCVLAVGGGKRIIGTEEKERGGGPVLGVATAIPRLYILLPSGFTGNLAFLAVSISRLLAQLFE